MIRNLLIALVATPLVLSAGTELDIGTFIPFGGSRGTGAYKVTVNGQDESSTFYPTGFTLDFSAAYVLTLDRDSFWGLGLGAGIETFGWYELPRAGTKPHTPVYVITRVGKFDFQAGSSFALNQDLYLDFIYNSGKVKIGGMIAYGFWQTREYGQLPQMATFGLTCTRTFRFTAHNH